MIWARVARARLVGFFRKEQLEEELDEELRFHVTMRTRENIARGMSEAEASRAAQRQLGNLDHIKDECRDVSGGGALEVLWQDVRFAGRSLRKDLGFTVVAVVALALGIGANTALFTVMSSVFLRPLPYPAAERIMAIWSHERGQPQARFPFSYPDFLDLQSQNHSFERLGGYRRESFVVESNGGDASEVEGGLVTSDIFHLLGVKAATGRTFTRKEDEPGGRGVVISHQFWEEQFGKAANVTGANLNLNGESHRVIGVMPPEFRFPVQNKPAQFWTTFARYRETFDNGAPAITTRRDALFVGLLGRLKHDTRRTDAEADIASLVRALAESYPENNYFSSSSVSPWLEDLTRGIRPALMMLVGAALCVLGVACANVANLLLARGSTRQKEIAVRSAVGAGRRRILRQLLTESLLLAGLGAGAGLLLALGATSAIVALLPADFPRASEIVPDIKVLAFTAITAVVTSCVFGFAPAWRSARCDPARVLNDCSRGDGETPRGRRTRNLLVMTEIVIAFVLLAAASSLLRNLWQLQNASPGFNPDGLVTTQLSLPDRPSAEWRGQLVAAFDEILARVSSLEGVQSASAVTPLPRSQTHPVCDYAIEGRTLAKADLPRAEPHIVEPNFFRTMEIPILRGRDFNQQDTRDGLPVVIINETLARNTFGNEDPIGKRITPGMAESGIIAEREIIGVVADIKCKSLGAPPLAEVYLPHSQMASPSLVLVVRGEFNPDALLASLRDIAAEVNGAISIEQPRPMHDYLADGVAQPRLNSTLLTAFALLAVVLTAIGVYGVMAYSVAQRRHEIGIRLALGAQPPAVFRLVMGEGIRLVGWSILIGGMCSALATPVLRKFSYGVAGGEASAILLVALLVSAVAIFACWVPARRASGENPLLAIAQR